jgi:hypothetical protein
MIISIAEFSHTLGRFPKLCLNRVGWQFMSGMVVRCRVSRLSERLLIIGEQAAGLLLVKGPQVLEKHSGSQKSVNPALGFYKDITATDPEETFERIFRTAGIGRKVDIRKLRARWQ